MQMLHCLRREELLAGFPTDSGWNMLYQEKFAIVLKRVCDFGFNHCFVHPMTSLICLSDREIDPQFRFRLV
jgi:hypothetical protein